eukprot:COSAG01_NODE_6325_length_3734_cov_3.565062_3_plen_42_part_00
MCQRALAASRRVRVRTALHDHAAHPNAFWPNPLLVQRIFGR